MSIGFTGVLFSLLGVCSGSVCLHCRDDAENVKNLRVFDTSGNQTVYESGKGHLIITGSNFCSHPLPEIEGVSQSGYDVKWSSSSTIWLTLRTGYSWPSGTVYVVSVACEIADSWFLAPNVNHVAVAKALPNPLVLWSEVSISPTTSPFTITGYGFETSGTSLELSSPGRGYYVTFPISENSIDVTLIAGGAFDTGPLRCTGIQTAYGSVDIDVAVAIVRTMDHAKDNQKDLAPELVWNFLILLLILAILVFVRLAIRWKRRRKNANYAAVVSTESVLHASQDQPAQAQAAPSCQDSPEELCLPEGGIVMLVDANKEQQQPAQVSDMEEAADTLPKPLLV